MKKFLAALAGLSFLFTSETVIAQHNERDFCGTGIPTEQYEAELARLIAQQKLTNKAAKGQTPLYTIPVIIHVIHGGQSVGTYPNLAQGQLISQIQVLNNDFAGIGYNSGAYPSQAFVNYAMNNANLSPGSMDDFSRIRIADCRIEFCLAAFDTLGNPLPEPGIDRIDYNAKGWADPASINSYSSFKNYIDNTVKPQSIWNVSKYMNIWITDENINAVGGLLGYATFPPLSTLPGIPGTTGSSTKDGFWCYSKAFGSIDYFPSGTYYGSNNRGRVSTHEIGHYLGLRHIWGDGVCATDYCTDTPSADDKNYNSPVYPWKTNGCAGNSPDGEMYMNFMDYTSDVAKYMYTEDQAIRMQTAMSNSPYRKFLGTHNLCSVQPVAATSSFSIPSYICGGGVLTPTNHAKGTPVPSYTWNVSGGVIVLPHANSPYTSLNFSSPGVYTISLTTDNGTVSTTSKVFTVHPMPNVAILGAPQVACQGAVITLTATGANWYAWSPGSILSPTISYVANSQKTFSVIGTGNGNCKSTSVVTIDVGICTGLEEQYAGYLSVFPNPTSGIITLRHTDLAQMQITITDVAGKMLAQLRSSTGETEVDLNNYEKGIYFISLTDPKGGKVMKKVVRE